MVLFINRSFFITLCILCNKWDGFTKGFTSKFLVKCYKPLLFIRINVVKLSNKLIKVKFEGFHIISDS